MCSATRLRFIVQLICVVIVCLAAPGCEDDDASPTGPSPIAGDPGAGAGAVAGSGGMQVRGDEWLAWSQAGNTSQLRFRAYLDNRPVELSKTTCSDGECKSPLPSMSDGAHTIALVSVSGTAESERSDPITLQKMSAHATASALPLAAAQSTALRLTPVITIGGLEFTADAVATGVRATAQLASLPDGRLLVSDADGRVRMVHPGEEESREPALEARMLTAWQPVGPMGIASHPDFVENRLVYLSLLEPDPRGAMHLRVLRLREIGDALGEAATLYEAPVAASALQTADVASLAQPGPRMAFGPDRLLYVMLPPGVEFVNEPAASTPRASMLRLTDAGRPPSVEPLTGITASPLAFAWHQTSGALWVMFRSETGETAMQSLESRARAMSAEAPRLRVREGIGAAAGTLFLQSAPDDLLVARALIGTRTDGSKGLARLALPLQRAQKDGMPNRIGDLVAGNGGTLFVVTSNGLGDGKLENVASGVVVRLRPLIRSTTR